MYLVEEVKGFENAECRTYTFARTEHEKKKTKEFDNGESRTYTFADTEDACLIPWTGLESTGAI